MQGGDQDQEERRWNKRTQQMLHGLQVLHVHDVIKGDSLMLPLYNKMNPPSATS